MKRNLFLDAARGVLSLTIVFVHILWLGGLEHSGARGAIGSWAVDAFMVLAGYVALSSYRPEPYAQYLAKRFFRLFPVLIVCGLLAERAGTHLFVTAWFISLLIQFYLVFPLFMWGIGKYGRRVLIWLLALSLFCYLPPIRDSFKSFAPMYDFLPQNLLWFVFGMIAFYLVDPYVMDDLSAKLSRYPVLIKMGELSYSTYLVHWPILFAISHLIPQHWQTLSRIVGIALLGVPVTCAATSMMYHWVELPGIALGKRLLRPKATPVPA